MLEQMIGNLSKSVMQIGVMVFVLIVVAVVGFFLMNMKKYNEIVRIREPGGKTYSRKARKIKDSSGAYLLQIDKFKDKIQYPTPSFFLPNGKPVHELYRTYNPKLPFVPMKFVVKEGVSKLVGEDLDPLIWASHDNIEADKQYNKWQQYLPLIQTGAKLKKDFTPFGAFT